MLDKRAAVAAFLLASASSVVDGAPPLRSPTGSPAATYTAQFIIQVCIPNRKVVYEDLTIGESGSAPAQSAGEARSRANAVTAASSPVQSDEIVVRKWVPTDDVPRYWIGFDEALNRDGLKSFLKRTINLIGNTTADQPLYEQREYHRVGEYIALAVELQATRDGHDQRVSYWFRLPPAISPDEFTPWNEPISEEDEATRNTQRNPTLWNLTHGVPMEIHEVGVAAPRMRFETTITPAKPFDDRARRMITDYYRRSAEAAERRYVVPKRNGVAIPSC